MHSVSTGFALSLARGYLHRRARARRPMQLCATGKARAYTAYTQIEIKRSGKAKWAKSKRKKELLRVRAPRTKSWRGACITGKSWYALFSCRRFYSPLCPCYTAQLRALLVPIYTFFPLFSTHCRALKMRSLEFLIILRALLYCVNFTKWLCPLPWKLATMAHLNSLFTSNSFIESCSTFVLWGGNFSYFDFYCHTGVEERSGSFRRRGRQLHIMRISCKRNVILESLI